MPVSKRAWTSRFGKKNADFNFADILPSLLTLMLIAAAIVALYYDGFYLHQYDDEKADHLESLKGIEIRYDYWFGPVYCYDAVVDKIFHDYCTDFWKVSPYVIPTVIV